MDTINCAHCGEQKDIELCDYAPDMYHEVACAECGKGIEFSWSYEPVPFFKDTYYIKCKCGKTFSYWFYYKPNYIAAKLLFPDLENAEAISEEANLLKLNWQPISELKNKLKDGDLYGFFAYCPSEKEAVWIVHATIDEEGIIGYFGIGKEEYYYLDHRDCFSHFAIIELNKPCE